MTSVAYADHLMILKSSWGSMCKNVRIWDKFSKLTGLVNYLGIQVSPGKGILKPPVRDLIRKRTKKISRAKLKPPQKIEIVRTYTLQRVIYVANHSMAGCFLLEGCGNNIQTVIKKCLHMMCVMTGPEMVTGPYQAGCTHLSLPV